MDIWRNTGHISSWNVSLAAAVYIVFQTVYLFQLWSTGPIAFDRIGMSYINNELLQGDDPTIQSHNLESPKYLSYSRYQL